MINPIAVPAFDSRSPGICRICHSEAWLSRWAGDYGRLRNLFGALLLWDLYYTCRRQW